MLCGRWLCGVLESLGDVALFQSIRARLALSFAAIAVFAVFTLGVVLLVILTNYYSNQEQDYLRSNVWTISRIVGHMMSSEMSQEEVQPLICIRRWIQHKAKSWPLWERPLQDHSGEGQGWG